ncbi:MAG: hypothetical protein K6G63_01470 [Eubacterium sp.]|nr:hypothetical protein [Eubacterium sp.]
MKARTTSSDEINTDASTTTPTTDTDMTEETPIALDRNLYKSIKKMNRATLEGLIQDIYENGRKKGLKEAAGDDHTGEPEINLDLRELEKQNKAVKGVGEKRAEEIMGIVEKWLW